MQREYLRLIYRNLDLPIPDATEIEEAYGAAQRCAAITRGTTMFPRTQKGRPTIMQQISKFARFLAGVEGFQRPIAPPAPPNTSPALRARLLALHILSATAGPGALK